MTTPPPKQFSGIFISYRREDSLFHSDRLYGDFRAHFGADQLFIDIDHIEEGEDFPQVIEGALRSCAVLIAVIGRGWLSARKGKSRRLDDPNDYVRLEIAAALRRNIRVIPVLVQGATMPAPDELPKELAALPRRLGLELSDRRWRQDVGRLISVVEKALAREQEARRRKEEEEEERRAAEALRLRAEEDARRAKEEAHHAEEEARRAAEAEQRRREAEEARQKQRAEEEERERLRLEAERARWQRREDERAELRRAAESFRQEREAEKRERQRREERAEQEHDEQTLQTPRHADHVGHRARHASAVTPPQTPRPERRETSSHVPEAPTLPPSWPQPVPRPVAQRAKSDSGRRSALKRPVEMLRRALGGGRLTAAAFLALMFGAAMAVLVVGVLVKLLGGDSPQMTGPANTATALATTPPGHKQEGHPALPPANACKPLETVENSVGMELVCIPSGEFLMGSFDGDPDERPQHRVWITKEFFIGKHEVTQGQWRAVMGSTPESPFKGDDLPVVNVSWSEAMKFIHALNERQDEYRYRLPSEAEWEYACRARTTGPYAGNIGSLGWYLDTAKDLRPRPVGTAKRANDFDLYDMHGNVWEWCEDNFHPNYEGDPPLDGSAWLDGDDSLKVLRGGAWSSYAYDCRCSNRNHWPADSPAERHRTGLRVVAQRR